MIVVMKIYQDTDATASNFNAEATDDGSCIPHINGCTNPESPSYNPEATPGNPEATSACIGVIYGCITPTTNTLDGGSAPSFPCTEVILLDVISKDMNLETSCYNSPKYRL